MSDRTLFIEDVHGCIEELEGLLELAEFRSKKDRLFFVGDLINPG
jgi:serine/threonine protein phosphatase 1